MKRPKPDGSKLEDWIEPINARGIFARITSKQKGMIDRSVASDFSRSMQAIFGVRIDGIAKGTDPPDILASLMGQAITIELAELLKRDVRERVAGRTQGRAFNYAVRCFSVGPGAIRSGRQCFA